MGEALALPAREGGAVLAQHRVEPLGKPLDELQAVRRPCSLGHLFVGGAFAADANIVRNRVVEKDHVLEDYGDVREPRFLGELGDVLSRAEDPAAVGSQNLAASWAQVDLPEPLGRRAR